MNIKNKKCNRQSIRLHGYNYSYPGAYFITICTPEQKMLLKFKCVQVMIHSVWNSLPDRFPSIKLDEFVIMPNHVHAILCINIVGADLVSARNKADLVCAPPLSRIIQAFKSITTHKYILGVKINNWPMFNKRLWQRNYYDHIIRSEKSLNCIREYIINNPTRWEFDKENPQGKIDKKEEDFWKEIHSQPKIRADIKSAPTRR